MISTCFLRQCCWNLRGFKPSYDFFSPQDTSFHGCIYLNLIIIAFFFYRQQILFIGIKRFSPGPFLAIDDVSFTKEPCKLIPWSSGKDKDYSRCQFFTVKLKFVSLSFYITDIRCARLPLTPANNQLK